MKTNVILAGIVLGLLCVLGGIPLIGLLVFGVAVGLFIVRNGMVPR